MVGSQCRIARRGTSEVVAIGNEVCGGGGGIHKQKDLAYTEIDHMP